MVCNDKETSRKNPREPILWTINNNFNFHNSQHHRICIRLIQQHVSTQQQKKNQEKKLNRYVALKFQEKKT